MSRGRHVEFFNLCRCGCGEIVPISRGHHSWTLQRDYSRLPCLPLWHHVLTEDWRSVARAVVVAVDVPRPTATPARVDRHGLSVDGDQGAPDHPQDTYPSTCALPGASQASGSPGRPNP